MGIDRDRRRFFSLLWDSVSEKAGIVHANQAAGCSAESSWHDLGHLADYPPGTVAPVPEARIVVVSTSEGIYAVDEKEFFPEASVPRRPLRFTALGVLQVGMTGAWKRDEMLSVMTGERIRQTMTTDNGGEP